MPPSTVLCQARKRTKTQACRRTPTVLNKQKKRSLRQASHVEQDQKGRLGVEEIIKLCKANPDTTLKKGPLWYRRYWDAPYAFSYNKGRLFAKYNIIGTMFETTKDGEGKETVAKDKELGGYHQVPRNG
ncbi:MAG: hypothetical protein LQ338_008370 [Usnochroma carphineum]|nr:MAG: hypothetical protein LQ338_008370 [Usnochroma carphineum]